MNKACLLWCRALSGPPRREIEIRLFVPFEAYAIQLAVLLVGALCLLLLGRMSLSMLLALSYPIGVVICGMVQTICFTGGFSSVGLPVLIILIAIGLITFCLRRSWRNLKINNLFESKGNKWLIVAVMGLVIIAFWVSQSSGYGEYDPRWMWAQRAKVIYQFQGFDNPYYTVPGMVRINPTYPIFFSAFQSLILRISGGSDKVIFLRPIGFFFFCSFCFLWFAIKQESKRVLPCLVALLIATACSKLWAIAVDENMLDFPLALFAAFAFFMLVVLEKRINSNFILLIVGIGLAGMKLEGFILAFLLAFLSSLNHVWSDKRSTDKYKGLVLFCLGILIALSVYLWGMSQMASFLTNENVGIRDLSVDAMAANVSRVPQIIYFLVDYMLDWTQGGLFFVILILSVVVMPKKLQIMAFVFCLSYIFIMIFPFWVTPMDLKEHLHAAMPRLLYQVMPIGLFSIWHTIYRSFPNWP